MKRWVLITLAVACVSCTYDTTDYSGEVRVRAAAELHCAAADLQLTPIPDDHGVHTYVVDGCGCTATYNCAWSDRDGCNREPTLEPDDASCR